MAAYAGVFRFCFGVVRSSGCCPAAAAAAAQRPGGCRPDEGSSRPRSRPAGRQHPLRGRAAAVWRRGSIRLDETVAGLCPNGCCDRVPISYVFFICCRLRVARCSIESAGVRPRTRRWALALRPEHHPRSDQSGHVEQPACRTRCPKEPHAQRSWHLQRSPPAQSEDLPPEVWLAESLRRRAARRGEYS